jgi:hypothetical protein
MRFDARLRKLERNPNLAKPVLIVIVEQGEDYETKLAEVLNGRQLEDFGYRMILDLSGSWRRSDGPPADVDDFARP